MKITIAINGEGRGHFSRALAIAEFLVTRHEVSFYVPEHLIKELSERFPGHKVRAIPYFAFIHRGFRIDYLETAIANMGLVFGVKRISEEIARELRREKTQMILSDFEPFSSRAAKMLGIPVLQLNHPGIVTRIREFSPASIVASLVSRYMMAYSDKTVICSFFDGDVGPIIREELRNKKISRGGYFVVYQKPQYEAILSPVIERIGMDRFKVFPDARLDYATALAGCAGLIAPAGHQSISEALALGKPVFAIPVKGQYEQELNARKLRESGFGDYCYGRDLHSRLPRFIAEISRYEDSLRSWRGGKRRSSKNAWFCEDDTHRAMDIIERFISESQWRPDWNRRNPAYPLLASLLFAGHK